MWTSIHISVSIRVSQAAVLNAVLCLLCPFFIHNLKVMISGFFVHF